MMQKKRNIRQIILLAVLIASTSFAYWRSNSASIAETEKDIFKVENFQEINRVVLESKNEKIDLEFSGRWRVNDQYDADRNMINLLFATLQEAEPKRPLASSLRDSIGLVLEMQGVKVSLFEGDVLRKEFFAGGNSQKTQAYFKLKGNQAPYLVMIPGYRDYVSRIFELGESGWRDKYIFGFNWRNFKSLEAKFPDDPGKGFFVGMNENNYFNIEGLTNADTSKLNDFLDNVSLLTADRFLPQNLSDSLKTLNPEMIITVSDVAAQQHTLALFNVTGAAIPGLVNGVQPAVFDRRKIAEIAHPRSYFKRDLPVNQ